LFIGHPACISNFQNLFIIRRYKNRYSYKQKYLQCLLKPHSMLHGKNAKHLPLEFQATVTSPVSEIIVTCYTINMRTSLAVVINMAACESITLLHCVVSVNAVHYTA